MFTCWISLNRASASFLSEVRDACLLSNSFNYTQQQQHILYALDGSIPSKLCSVYACKHIMIYKHTYAHTFTRTHAHGDATDSHTCFCCSINFSNKAFCSCKAKISLCCSSSVNSLSTSYTTAGIGRTHTYST